MQQPNSQISQEEDFNLKDVLNQYLKFWPWFVLSVFCFYHLAFLYVRYSTYIYNNSGNYSN